MPRNKLSDLNNLLFEQLERLSDEELTDRQLQNEIQRSKAMSQIAEEIINTHQVVIEAQKAVLEYSDKPISMQALIEMK